MKARVSISTCVALASTLGLQLGAEAQPKKKRATVTIQNKADWDIHHFYLSSTDEKDWGPDQLGKDTIGKGEFFKLADVPCDYYDVKLVDEDGDQCVIEDVDICGSDEVWTITNKDLLKCQVAS